MINEYTHHGERRKVVDPEKLDHQLALANAVEYIKAEVQRRAVEHSICTGNPVRVKIADYQGVMMCIRATLTKLNRVNEQYPLFEEAYRSIIS